MSIDAYASFLPPARQAAAYTPAPSHEYTEITGYSLHTLRRANPHAPYRMIVVHGAGGYSEALWPLAAQIRPDLVDLAAVDLPLYGHTRVGSRCLVRYPDWVNVLVEYLRATDDGRPVVLFGLSIGGLLAAEAAHLHGGVAGVIATCLADPRRMVSRYAISRLGCATYLSPFLPLGLAPGLSSVMLPMRRLADMGKMSHNPELTRLCARDPHGGGSPVPLGFLSSLLTYKHEVLKQPSTWCFGPADNRPRPRILLLHPAQDQWTSPALSLHTLRRIGAPWQYTALPNCGHFPIEEPGLTRMVHAVTHFLAE